jgi:DNA-binding NarL/FixJ family response regulator
MRQLCDTNNHMLNKPEISAHPFPGMMEFKQEELVEREIEIACYLFQGFSLTMIAEITGMNNKILAAHLRNMMKKLQAINMSELIQLLKEKEL